MYPVTRKVVKVKSNCLKDLGETPLKTRCFKQNLKQWVDNLRGQSRGTAQWRELWRYAEDSGSKGPSRRECHLTGPAHLETRPLRKLRWEGLKRYTCESQSYGLIVTALYRRSTSIKNVFSGGCKVLWENPGWWKHPRSMALCWRSQTWMRLQTTLSFIWNSRRDNTGTWVMKPRSIFAFKEGTLKGVFWDYVESSQCTWTGYEPDYIKPMDWLDSSGRIQGLPPKPEFMGGTHRAEGKNAILKAALWLPHICCGTRMWVTHV